MAGFTITTLSVIRIFSNIIILESFQLGNTYIADIDKCPQDKCCLEKCRGDSSNLLYMFPGPYV